MPFAKVSGGELYYEESGSGAPVILSAGGLQGNLDSYSDVVGALAGSYRVITYDRRFGRHSNCPLVVQTWDMVYQDVFDLMDSLSIDQAFLGGGSFGAAISFGCAFRDPERVKAIFPSNIGGRDHLRRLFGGQVVSKPGHGHGTGSQGSHRRFELNNRFSPFSPELAQHDADYRGALEAMRPEEFAQIMRNTIYALFDGPYVSLGMTEEALKGIRTPTMIMPGYNDIHPRTLAERVHRLAPTANGEKRRHTVTLPSNMPSEFWSSYLSFRSQFQVST